MRSPAYLSQAICHAGGRIVPVSGGYEYHYYLKDHLGNTRAVVKGTQAAPVLMQEYHYYPFGMQMDGNWVTPTGLDQKYKYNGKELVDDLGLNWYDYGARWYDPSVARWMQVDPMAEKNARWSPYNYCINNPVVLIDPDGMDFTGRHDTRGRNGAGVSTIRRTTDLEARDRLIHDAERAATEGGGQVEMTQTSSSGGGWYRDEDGTAQYDPTVNSGASNYLGEDFKEKGASGKMIYYNKGGSIFFKNETDAYNYIWKNTENTGKEHLGVVFSDGVAVLPSHANDANTSEIESVGFRFELKGGKVYLASDNYTHSRRVLGTVHSHNADKSGSEGMSGSDIMAFGRRTPGLPAIVFENNDHGIGGFFGSDSNLLI